eukprot:3895776-Prymnesium_polylepis.1
MVRRRARAAGEGPATVARAAARRRQTPRPHERRPQTRRNAESAARRHGGPSPRKPAAHGLRSERGGGTRL